MKNITEIEIRELLIKFEKCDLNFTKLLLIELKDRNLTIGSGVLNNILKFYNLTEINELYILNVDRNMINYELKSDFFQYVNSNSKIRQTLLKKIVTNYQKEDIDNISRCIIEMASRGEALSEKFSHLLVEHFKLKTNEDLFKSEDPAKLIELKDYHKKDFIKDARTVLFIFIFLGFLEASIVSSIKMLPLIGFSINIFILNYIVKEYYLKYINRFTGVKFGLILGIISLGITTLFNIIIYCTN